MVGIEKQYKLLYPMRVCLISVSCDGKDNFMPAVWVYPISAEPVLYGVAISKQRYTFELLKKSKYFVINVPGFDLKDKLEKFGRTSGKDGDKFKLWDMTKEKCENIPSISIKETAISMEMKSVKEIELGDHVLFVGELIHVKKRNETKGLYQSFDGSYLEM